ncbi:MAG: cold shock domain-containing protein [Bacteroidia bacterium]
MRGTVLFFNVKKGYGFIRNNETELDIFVHRKGLNEMIKEGDDVTFDETEGTKSVVATNVSLFRREGDMTPIKKFKRPRIRKP